MKNKAELVIFLFFAFTFLLYIFPFPFVDAAKFQSGVTINAPSTTETEKICDDQMDNDNDGKIDANDEDCASTSSQPVAEICANGQDDNGDGLVDEPGCKAQEGVRDDICANGLDDDGDGIIDEADCIQQEGVMGEICANMQDDDADGIIDEAECTQQAGPAAGTCGLEIVSGVPINYGQLSVNQESAEQQVELKNVGSTTASIMVKGGDWVSDAASNPTVSGPEVTRVAIAPNIPYPEKAVLKSNEFELGSIDSQQTVPVFFNIFVPGSFSTSGSLHQDVTIDLIC